MKPKKLPFEVFLKSFEYAPRPAVNLLVVREDGAILLTKRKKPPFPGCWHLPGSFILKGEPLIDCAVRVAKEELGFEIEMESELFQLVGIFDDIDGDPRGHVVDVVYRVELTSIEKGRTLNRSKVRPFQSSEIVGDTAEMRFFKQLPKDIGFNHRDTLRLLGYS